MPTIDLARAVRDAADPLVTDLRDLVRAAEGGHDAVQAFVAKRLQAAGAQVDVIDYRPRDIHVDFELGAPTTIEGTSRYVMGSYGAGDDGLLLWAHSDSEVVDPTGWTRPLFEGVQEDGRMYGWGIGDDLVGVGLMLGLAKLQAQHSFLGPKRVLLASVPSKQRAQAIIDAMDRGYVGSGSVYLHPAESGVGLNEIKAIASGILRFRIRVPGRRPDTREPGHTVFWHTGVDAVLHAARVINAIKEFGDARAARTHYAPVHDAIGRSTNVHVSHIEAGTVNKLGKMPTHADLFVSLTFPPTEPMAGVQAEVVELLEHLSAQDAWLRDHPLEVEWLVGINGAATSLDSPLYRMTHEAIEAATGSEPHVNPLHAGSDIRNPLLYKGIDSVGIGPLVGDLTVSGGVDEWADVADYLRAVEVVCRISRDHSRRG